MFLVESVVRLEPIYQKTFQCLKCGLLHQSPFQAAPAEDLPLQRHYVGGEHLVDHIDRLYRPAESRRKLVKGAGVLAPEDERRGRTVINAAPAPELGLLRLPSCFHSSWAQTPPYARLNESPTHISLYINDSGMTRQRASGTAELVEFRHLQTGVCG